MSESARRICGIVMPISASNDYTASHWADVKDILTGVISSAGLDGILVSDADASGVIHKRIVQNLYDNPLVICDVSGKNPNVMFELGMRLAFDKPTVLVKDSATPYLFDTGSIEHVEYPRDLRFAQILEFKEKLSLKITATLDAFSKDQNYSTFLKNFGQFKVAKLDETEISSQEFILEELKNMRLSVDRLAKQSTNLILGELLQKNTICLAANGVSITQLKNLANNIQSYPGVYSVKLQPQLDGRNFMTIEVDSKSTELEVKNMFESGLRNLQGFFSKSKTND